MSKSKNCTCPSCGGTRIAHSQFILSNGDRAPLCRECREGGKTCNRCGEFKPLDDFYPHQRKDQHKISRSAQCKSCVCAQKRIEQPDRRLKRYGLTAGEYNARITEQNGKCAGCGLLQQAHEWHVDHDHACCPGERTCGKCVRGLLCRDCNLALGFARDDIARLLGLADYLAGFRGNGDLPILQSDIRRAVPTGT